MSTQQIFKTVDVVRLEVEGVWATLPNIVPNPNGEFGAWGWRHKIASAGLSVVAGPAFRVTRLSALGSPSVATDLLPLEPNWGPGSSDRWVKGSVRRVGGTSGMQVSIQFLDKAGTILSATTLTTSQTTNGTVTLAAVQAPSPAKYAALSIVHNGATIGNTVDFDNAILVTGTQAAVTASGLAVEAPWVNVISPATSIDIKREGLTLGTLSAVVRDSTIDPATANTIRKGRKLRATALAGATWETLFAGKIDTASVTYDLLHPNATKRARIAITAVDPAATLAKTPRKNSVPAIADLPDVLDGAGVPWNVNGSVAPVSPVTPLAVTDTASALDQVALTRDSAVGFAWVSRKGILNAWNRGVISAASVATLAESTYTDLEVGFDPADVINDVTVKSRAIDPVTLATVETSFGPFTDDVSAQGWGKYHKDFSIVSVAGYTYAMAETYANSIMQNLSQPRVRATALRMPVTDAAHISTSRALLDLYDPVTVVNASKALNQLLRVTSITHRIQPRKWTIDLGFDEAAGVAAPMPPDPRNSNVQAPSPAKVTRAGVAVLTFPANSRSTGIVYVFPTPFATAPVVVVSCQDPRFVAGAYNATTTQVTIDAYFEGSTVGAAAYPISVNWIGVG